MKTYIERLKGYQGETKTVKEISHDLDQKYKTYYWFKSTNITIVQIYSDENGTIAVGKERE